MGSCTAVKTLKVRVKDKHARVLARMAVEVNQGWNYANDLSDRMIRERGHWMTGFDLQAYTNGASKEFEYIGSPTIQETCAQFASKRRTAKRRKLKFRKSFGERRALGWIPFKSRAVSWKNGQVFFAGHHFGVWDSYGLSRYAFRSGCFTEDARARWYFCVVVGVPVEISTGQGAIGIDFGLKATATCSDGQRLEGRTFRKYERKHAALQRAGRVSRARALAAKIRNVRHDALHKFSTAIVGEYGEIYVGNVSSAKLIKTEMAKSVLDAGWSSLKTMLEYKARQRGIVYREVNEAYTTRGCSECGSLTGPQGLRGLSVRDWQCSGCGVRNDRDVNAARNICHLGAGHRAP